MAEVEIGPEANEKAIGDDSDWGYRFFGFSVFDDDDDLGPIEPTPQSRFSALA